MLNLIDIQPQQDEIYLDSNATTPVLPQAAQAAIHTMNLCYGNPSSSHMTGIKAKYILESTRTLARQAIGADSGEIIFTSGATEGIQTSIISALNASRARATKLEKPTLLYGATEHKAVPETLKHWNEMLNIGAQVLPIPVDENGILDLDFIAKEAKNALMICTMAANNETGVWQDLNQLEKVIRAHNKDVLWMVDSVQALGKIGLNLAQTSIDYAPFSGHKLYAPKGIGMLYVRKNTPYTPFIAGGGQESGLRSGTENLPGIASLNAIFRLLNDPADDTFKSHQVLCDYRHQLADTLEQAFPDIVFNHNFDYSLPTTLNFSVKGLSSKDIMDLFDAAKIRVSSGSACSSKVSGSFVLDAMGKEKWQSEGAIRLSFGPATTQLEIDRACDAITKAVTALRNSCLLLSKKVEKVSSKTEGLQQWVYDQHCTWCYIDKQHKQVLLIDPVAELVDKFKTLVQCQNYDVVAVLSTHQHENEDNCTQMLRTLVGDAIKNQPTDTLGWQQNATLQVELQHSQQVPAIVIGNKVLAKLALPGHTKDSVAYLLGEAKDNKLLADDINYVFIGDTLQIGGIGRSDLPSGCSASLFQSLLRLNQVINDDTLICPAHDYQQLFTTTLGLEKQNTPLLAQVLGGQIEVNRFVEQKALLDSKLTRANVLSFCGNINIDSNPSQDINPAELKSFLEQNPDVQIFDVRESHEHEAHHQQFLVDHPVVNVPLSQITQFVQSHGANKLAYRYLCICRSGSRSDVAAKTLKRMGFAKVYHVPGGYALLSH
ncbi:aminotransferase class V-fold PLP-dependent enzyme [Thalassotalea aquiviva]|uniref:aminotransferase class V-fold PLP-dependent enzyme n=1 Tax=Thalassotalea aquiviva TaxID=3242415 RepID=UPI00352ABC62